MSPRFLFELKTFSTYRQVAASLKLAKTGTVTQVSGGITTLILDWMFWSVVQNLDFLLLCWFQQWPISLDSPLLTDLSLRTLKAWPSSSVISKATNLLCLMIVLNLQILGPFFLPFVWLTRNINQQNHFPRLKEWLFLWLHKLQL